MATEGSWIPDGLKATLDDLVGAYGQIQSIKLQNQLAQAQASAAALGLPNATSNPQAQAMPTDDNRVNPLFIGGAILVGVVLLYVVVR